MTVRPLRQDLLLYLTKHNLLKKFEKQVTFFEVDPRYPSLNVEMLEPKSLKLYSFRVDRKYRAMFAITQTGEIEIVDINDHYQ